MVQTGSGAMQSSTQANVARRERLRQMALEAADFGNDPYFMKNHLGQYECKLCLSLHTTEGSYLAHTQGKRHQENLAKRNAKLARENTTTGPSAASSAAATAPKPKRMAPRIGRPGYKVIKQRDPVTGARSLLFHLLYPLISGGCRPRYRFMSAYEQRVEVVQDKFQYVIFAAEPYETIAFKIPATEIDRNQEKLFVHWDDETNTFTLQLHFVAPKKLTDGDSSQKDEKNGLDSEHEDDDENVQY